MIRLFSVFIPTSILGLLLSEIILIAFCYTLAIRWQMEDTFSLYMMYDNGIVRVLVVTVTIVVGLYLSDCYERVRIRSRLVFLQQMCLIIGVAFLMQALFSYVGIEIRMPRQAILAGSIACLLLMPFWRTLYTKVALRLLGAEKLLFAGTHPLQFTIASHLEEHPEFGMKPIGFVLEEENAAEHVPKEQILGTLHEIQNVAARLRPDRVIVGFSQATPQELQHVIQIQQAGFRADSLAETFEVVFGRVAISQVQQMQVAFQKSFLPSPLLLTLQVVYSWLIAFVGLILVSPILLFTALAVRFSSPGPILFRQVRTGRNNTTFMLYKFRSMYVDAEARTGAVWAQENDPRVTLVGRALRKYRLDELPQLFNVLRGEMAIVGPRPERPEFIKVLAEQIPFYMQRLAMRPGITGWAQINYRYGNTVEDTVIKLEYDLYYIKNYSPQLDMYVMFHTIKTMLLTRGAY